jgi:diguanylate cyclase
MLTSERADQWVRNLAPLPWLIFLAGGVATTLSTDGPEEAASSSYAALIVLAFFAVMILRLLLKATVTRGRARFAQLALAGAMALWSLGSALVVSLQSAGEVAFPSVGELLNIASYLLLATFVLLDAPRAQFTRGMALDAVVVWGATLAVASFMLIAPVTSHFDGTVVQLFVAVLFPLINVVLAGIVLSQVLTRERVWSSQAMMLIGGLVAIAIADSNFIARVPSSEGYSGDARLAIIWGVGFALIGEAASRSEPDRTGLRRADVRPAVLIAAAVIAILALVVNPGGLAGALMAGSAALTLLATGWRLTVALQQARGATEALRLSVTDELSGLGNRRAVLAATDQALTHQGPVSVLLFDIDSFKDVNDSLGHAVGDEVLIHLAERLKESLTSALAVARLGGDEFAAVLPSEDELELFELAQRARSALRMPLGVEGLGLSLDASVGIAVREETDESAIEMMRRADVAMYAAKENRAGVLVFDRSQDGMSQLRLQRGEELRSAIANGQLIAWYQPQVDARTQQVVAMEALVRWWHPTEGLLPPVAFLADARRAGLMGAMTESLMVQIIQDAKRWRADGLDLRVAMNWAPPELIGGRLLPALFSAIADAGLPPDSIQVEVTEESFLSDPERARMVLYELQGHGVQVSIDDYGSGFSSLAYLRDLPVQELKMDRAFVAPVVSDERSRMIVATTIQMARALGMRFVAEGVEDSSVVSELVPLGVDVLQGYHIARPMPAAAVAPWVREWERSQVVRLS